MRRLQRQREGGSVARLPRRRIHARRQRGVAIVEGALLITPLIVLMYSIFELGLAFVVAGSVQASATLAMDVARTAPMREQDAQRTVSYLYAQSSNLPFMEGCLYIRAWEFSDIEDIGYDYRDGSLFNYQDANEISLLASEDYLAGLPLQSDTDIMGESERALVLLELGCRWQFISGIFSNYMNNNGFDITVRSVAPYEYPREAPAP